jgi:hypothetical protein
MDTTASSASELLHNAMIGACAADSAARSIKGTKEGFTATMLKVAEESPESFLGLCEVEETRIRGLSLESGEDLKLSRNKAGTEWLIPGTWRNAKSVISGAIKRGVNLEQSFDAVRKENAEAARAEKAAKAGGADAANLEPGETFTIPGDGLGLTLGLLIRACAKLTNAQDREQAERALQGFIDTVHAQIDRRTAVAAETAAAAAAETAAEDTATEAAAALIEGAKPQPKRKGHGRKAANG